MIFVELTEGVRNRKKYRKRKNKQRQIKIRKKQTNKTKKTEQVTSAIKIVICALICNGELYRLSLEILLHYMIFVLLKNFISSAVKLCQKS